MFELITRVKGLNSLRSLAPIYSCGCITSYCDLGREVWIQYYKDEKMGTSVFSVGDSINMMGGVPTIILYVEFLDNSIGKTYDVYRYNGVLQIDRTIVDNIRHDVFVNIEEIVDKLKVFLNDRD